jgi:hypothetical protein
MGETNRSGRDSLCQLGVSTYNEQMIASRLQCLLLGLVTSSFGATAVPAAHAASPIGLWKGAGASAS